MSNASRRVLRSDLAPKESSNIKATNPKENLPQKDSSSESATSSEDPPSEDAPSEDAPSEVPPSEDPPSEDPPSNVPPSRTSSSEPPSEVPPSRAPSSEPLNEAPPNIEEPVVKKPSDAKILGDNIKRIETAIWSLVATSNREKTVYASNLRSLEYKIDETLNQVMNENFKILKLYRGIQRSQDVIFQKVSQLFQKEGELVEIEDPIPPLPYRSKTASFWDAFYKQNLDGMAFYYDSDVHKILPNTEGESPLCFASFLGNLEMVKFLIEKHAHINKPDGVFLQSPLMEAVSQGHLEIVKYLLQNHANVNQQDRYLETALHKAIRYNQSKIAKLLLDYGADEKLKNFSGQTPMDVGRVLYKTPERRECININLPGDEPLQSTAEPIPSTFAEPIPSTSAAPIPSISVAPIPSISPEEVPSTSGEVNPPSLFEESLASNQESSGDGDGSY